MPRAYTGSQNPPVADASAFAINSADDTKQVRVALGGLAPNTTAIITVTGNGTFPDPGTGGVVIGAAVTGGVAGRVLFEGAGPVVADDAGLTYNAATDALTVVGSYNGPGTGLTGTAASLTAGNASTLNGATFAAPGPIGGGTPGAAAHTTGSFTGKITSTVGNNLTVFESASATTGYQQMLMTNTGGGVAIGVMNSAGTAPIVGGIAYAGSLIGNAGLSISANGGSNTHANISNTGAITIPSTLSVNGALNLGVFTVGTLPNAGTSGQGATAFVTDATAPAYGVAVVGGGAVKIPVFSTGAAWNVG